MILSCAVQGSPHFTVSWYRNTEPVLPDQHFSIQGAHNETLFISAAQKRHSGAYQCFATRKGQTAQDFSIILLEGEKRKALPFWCKTRATAIYDYNMNENDEEKWKNENLI